MAARTIKTCFHMQKALPYLLSHHELLGIHNDYSVILLCHDSDVYP